MLAALGSLALIQEARQRGEVLDLVEATDTFSPAAGERARIEWRQRRSSDDATVRIIDRAGIPVRTLLDGGSLEGDDRIQVFHWNGRTDDGDPPGLYRIEILLRDQDREIVPEQSAIRLRRLPVEEASPDVDAVEWVGVLASCGAAATALVVRDARVRAAAMVLALVLAPALVAGDLWDTERFRDLRDSPMQLLALAVVAAIGISLLTAVILRWPAALPLLAFGVLAFRIPVELGGETSNLLIPLYLVIAAGTAATAIATLIQPVAITRGARDQDETEGCRLPQLAARVLPWLLAAVPRPVRDPERVLERPLEGDRDRLVLLRPVRGASRAAAPGPVDVEPAHRAVRDRLSGGAAVRRRRVWQFATRDLFWNPTVIAGNEVHTYFRVNSLFWDPNVLGRYLVLAALAATAYMLWTRHTERAIAAAAGCIVLLVGLTLSFSQSSILALLAGLLALVVLRWGWRWALVAGW